MEELINKLSEFSAKLRQLKTSAKCPAEMDELDKSFSNIRDEIQSFYTSQYKALQQFESLVNQLPEIRF